MISARELQDMVYDIERYRRRRPKPPRPTPYSPMIPANVLMKLKKIHDHEQGQYDHLTLLEMVEAAEAINKRGL